MYTNALHRGRKHFCRYCLQAFSKKEILKHHIKHCLKIMINKGLKYLRMVIKLNSKILKGNSPFIISVDFVNILVAEDNGKRDLKQRVLH